MEISYLVYGNDVTAWGLLARRSARIGARKEQSLRMKPVKLHRYLLVYSGKLTYSAAMPLQLYSHYSHTNIVIAY